MLSFKQVGYCYPGSDTAVLDGLDLEIAPGCYVVLLGANGSGKTTLACLANGLLLPEEGQVAVDGLDTGDAASIRAVRQLVGLVSQDPDEQIISTTVLDEVAFGPENLGLAPAEIALRTSQALAAVGLDGLADRDPNTLSGGEKQRLVLAGALAMQPRYLVMDESLAMLDGPARQSVLATVAALVADGCGVLHISHELALAAAADQVAVLSHGKLAYLGSPEVLLADHESLVKWQLLAPLPERPPVPVGEPVGTVPLSPGPAATAQTGCLSLADVSYSYQVLTGPPLAVLSGISVVIETGSYTLVSGDNGAGKSTLLRLMAGLIKPDCGQVAYGSPNAAANQHIAAPAPVPGTVGLVFQSPEDQLFAQTVAADVAYGPVVLGQVMPGSQAEADLVAWALAKVGLDAAMYADKSPFTLSGGEMRRVAIAGILSIQPRLMLFDEPTVGLDALGRRFVHLLIEALLADGVSVVVVSHQLDEFAQRVDAHYRLEAGSLWPM